MSWFVPPALAAEVAREAAPERDAVLAAAGEKVPRRRNRLLPPWPAVYFTLALRLPCQDALRSPAGDRAAGLAVPAATALTAARRRLGERPLELLFWRVAGVLLPSRDPRAAVGGLLAAAWDGTALKVPAAPENTAALGRPRHGGGRKARAAAKDGKAPPGEGHYPQMRVVALIACGTRALLGAAIGPLADGERKLAATLTGCLRPGTLLPADRGFWSVALWQACAATRAHLLWRVKSDIRLPARQSLPDGSWPSVVNGTREAHLRNMRNANRRSRGSRLPQEQGPLPGDATVRVIEFLITLTCEDGTTRTERYRAVTTLPDWRRYPSADLAAAYARRWGIESAYREAKSYLAGGRILRSRTPASPARKPGPFSSPARPSAPSSATPPPAPAPAASPSPPPSTPLAAPSPARPPPWPEPRARSSQIPSPAARPAPAPARSPTPPAPTPPGTASPSPYHRQPTTPSPSRHQAHPPGNFMTSSNRPLTGQPRLLKLLALGSADGFTALPSCSRLIPLTYAYVVRGSIWDGRRPLCIRGRRVPGPSGPRTVGEPATDERGPAHRRARTGPRTGTDQPTDDGGKGHGRGRWERFADRPPGFIPLTWHFGLPARCRYLPRHRTQAGCLVLRGRR